MKRLRKSGLKGRTVTLKIKYGDFKQITRAQSLPAATDDASTIVTTAKNLLDGTNPGHKGIRLLGISLSAFGEPAVHLLNDRGSSQLILF